MNIPWSTFSCFLQEAKSSPRRRLLLFLLLFASSAVASILIPLLMLGNKGPPDISLSTRLESHLMEIDLAMTPPRLRRPDFVSLFPPGHPRRHKRRVEFAVSDPDKYRGPVVQGWTPNGRSRNISRYFGENDATSFLISPRDKVVYLRLDPSKCLIVILVHSPPSSSARRRLIRQTWGERHHLRNFKCCLAFVLGTGAKANEENVTKEDSSFGDLLQGDFVDSYTNLTLKSIFGLGYMRLLLEKKGCKVQYLAKVDEDCFLHLGGLAGAITEAEERINSSSFIMGHVFGTGRNETIRPLRPLRNSTFASKWSVPSYMFSGAEYPMMVSGAGYAMGAQAAICVLRNVFRFPYFHLEDVLLTGFAAQDCGVTFAMHRGIKTWPRRPGERFDGERDVLAHYAKSEEVVRLHEELMKKEN